jgi:murein L,D-transpeptidase YafK
MKSLLITGVLCLGSLASCEERETTLAMSERTKLPGKQRAAAAAAAVRPALERDLEAAGLKYGDPVFLRAFKEDMVVEVFVWHRTSGKFKLFRSYPIAGSSGRLGPKLAEGDMQVPEGFYDVPPSAMNPQSQYHLSFNIGYPNAYDHARQRTGSAIMIHGNQISIGCLAMTDEKIEEIYTLCVAAHAGGQKFFRVHIFPFRMTDKRMAVAVGQRWEDFWKNLKEGYDAFEKDGTPPEIGVENQRYMVCPNVSGVAGESL